MSVVLVTFEYLVTVELTLVIPETVIWYCVILSQAISQEVKNKMFKANACWQPLGRATALVDFVLQALSVFHFDRHWEGVA